MLFVAKYGAEIVAMPRFKIMNDGRQYSPFDFIPVISGKTETEGGDGVEAMKGYVLV